MRLHRLSFRAALPLLLATTLFSTPRPAAAQFVVFDPANLGQAVVDYTMRGLEYALQGLEYAEAVQGVIHLGRQIQQLDSTIAQHRDAAMGRIGQLTDAFADLSLSDASTLLDADFAGWRNRLEGGADDLATAIGDMKDATLADYLLGELDAADVVTDAQLLGLYPGARGAQLADAWTEERESGDRMRAGDYATAEAAGRITTLLRDAQDDIDGRRGQAELSHTALQQAQVANQLTAAEMDIALAQLIAVQAQQAALERHQAELHARQALERWMQREQQRQTQLQDVLAAEQSRRAAYRTVGQLTVRHGN